ncbi:hypothetical protein P153DRAFT_208710 [Dothidotthia symphoricarpi CBS 119687]|uniref:Uncharacterized protein n=1 Tax=Dothidotthia symphoricarpi CBS 119687 TaxID=1392245 RepID=A0A6A6AJB7_9PLEO|nr:uncharacterized protein P153DRAFT_208710 [Dothidotthia symphoricarpi CBS 119687]KAF2131004.1 hypothetical protein P153DRAFT_208710 [Dothidotthia symphoricarpi CBS 119687]
MGCMSGNKAGSQWDAEHVLAPGARRAGLHIPCKLHASSSIKHHHLIQTLVRHPQYHFETSTRTLPLHRPFFNFAHFHAAGGLLVGWPVIPSLVTCNLSYLRLMLVFMI